MPGPHYEVYIQDLTLTVNPADIDVLNCAFTWNTGRQVDDALWVQYAMNDQDFNIWKLISGATKQTYNAPQITGGGAGNSYKVQLITQHNDNGTMVQKVVDEITILRPMGTSIAYSGTMSAKKINKTQFYLLLRVQGQNTDTSDYSMQLSAWNAGTQKFDDQGGKITVPAGGTTFHTYLLTLDQATYIYQYQGNDTVKVKLELFDNNGNSVTSMQNYQAVASPTVNAPPGNQNGSLPFDSGTISVHAQPDSNFDYSWDLQERLVAFVEWSVNPTGEGTLDLQISWYNTATEAWELLFEDSNVGSSGYRTGTKTIDQYYNDSYQILASLAGATTIQGQNTLTPNYEYPGTDTVEAIN